MLSFSYQKIKKNNKENTKGVLVLKDRNIHYPIFFIIIMLLSIYNEYSNCFIYFTKYNDAVKILKIIVRNYIKIYNVYSDGVVCGHLCL